jgi:DNA-binding Lrp family transcriptional regulator
MIREKLNLDERDSIIVQMLQKDPDTSQEDIAKKLKLSQPSVWARIRNLKNKGIIHSVNGVNFKTVDLNLAKVEVAVTDPEAIIKEFIDCPYFLNALITSGKFNLCLFFAGTSLKNIEGIVSHHLRDNKKVKDIELQFVVTTAKDFVIPLNIDDSSKHQKECKQPCKECYQETIKSRIKSL